MAQLPPSRSCPQEILAEDAVPLDSNEAGCSSQQLCWQAPPADRPGAGAAGRGGGLGCSGGGGGGGCGDSGRAQPPCSGTCGGGGGGPGSGGAGGGPRDGATAAAGCRRSAAQQLPGRAASTHRARDGSSSGSSRARQHKRGGGRPGSGGGGGAQQWGSGRGSGEGMHRVHAQQAASVQMQAWLGRVVAVSGPRVCLVLQSCLPTWRSCGRRLCGTTRRTTPGLRDLHHGTATHTVGRGMAGLRCFLMCVTAVCACCCHVLLSLPNLGRMCPTTRDLRGGGSPRRADVPVADQCWRARQAAAARPGAAGATTVSCWDAV